MRDTPSPRNTFRWFDPRARQIGSWGFTLNRLTALGLTFYLGLHLVVLNKLVQGQMAYDDFIALAQLPLIKFSEVVLITAVLFHGLNGIRLLLHAAEIGVKKHKLYLVIVLALSLLGSALFAIRLFNDG
ncbi:MAG: succinate dehydrogenase, cytochrome b556 subunit [Anaerolineales bacterium]